MNFGFLEIVVVEIIGHGKPFAESRESLARRVLFTAEEAEVR
jgi:hypothetical protein